jgi:FkbM family methyltransferase
VLLCLGRPNTALEGADEPSPSAASQGTRVVRLFDRIPGRIARPIRRNRGVSRLLRPLANRLLPEHAQPVTVRSGPAAGLKVMILPRTEKGYWAGTHESAVQDAVAAALSAGSVYWDVGAHCGFFVALASKLVGSGGAVVAVEPASDNLARLTRTLELNRCMNVRVLPLALGSREGKAQLYSHAHSTNASLARADGAIGSEEVQAARLDDLARQLPPPDLVKVDVEGAEVDVLEGGLDYLREARPPLIVEFHSSAALRAGRSLLDFYEFRQLEIGEFGATQWRLLPRPFHESP